DHLLRVNSVFHKWREVGLTVNLEKCAFGQNEVNFLGHIVGSGQHSPDPEKAEVWRNLSRPSTKKELRSFLGLASYYRDYIPNFPEIVLPPTDLTKRKVSNILPWSIEAEEALQKSKMNSSECRLCILQILVVRFGCALMRQQPQSERIWHSMTMSERNRLLHSLVRNSPLPR
ncbi:hypothetical protein AVEN_67393-1, partial [Araneus ventricosus]